MENQKASAPAEVAPRPVMNADLVEARLAALGIVALFIRVPELSKALGISQATIQAQMRSGRFPMPSRKFGSAFMVRREDFVEWYCCQPPNSGMAAHKDTFGGALDHIVQEAERDRGERIKQSAFSAVAQEMAKRVGKGKFDHAETRQEIALRVKRESRPSRARSL